MKNPRKLFGTRKTLKPDRIMAPLILWLNSVPDSDLHHMVHDLQSLDTLAEELNWSTPVPEEKEKRLEFERLVDSLNSRMRQFATYPAINTNSLCRPYDGPYRRKAGGVVSSDVFFAGVRGGGKPVEFRRLYAPIEGDVPPYQLVRHPCQGFADTPIFESHFQILAFLAFEEVVRQRWGWLLRKCDRTKCPLWFCASREDSTYCSARCRRRRHQDSPKYKEWRKKYDELMQKKKSFRSTSRKS